MRNYAGGIAAAAALVLAENRRRLPHPAAPAERRPADPALLSLRALSDGLALRRASLWAAADRQCAVPARFSGLVAQFSPLLRVRPAQPRRRLALVVSNTGPARELSLEEAPAAAVRMLGKREYRSFRTRRLANAA